MFYEDGTNRSLLPSVAGLSLHPCTPVYLFLVNTPKVPTFQKNKSAIYQQLLLMLSLKSHLAALKGYELLVRIFS